MSDIPRRLGGPAQSHLDRAIDRAVRELMHVDPRPGFRGRVLGRLDPEPVQSSSMFFRLAVGGGALAVLVLALMVARYRPTATVDVARVSPVADQRTARDAQPATPPVVTTPETTARAQVRRDGHRRPHRVTREPIPMPRIANVFGNRSGEVAAASVDSDTVWAAPERHEEQPGALPPLVIPAVEPPAPIVIGPLIPRGPGL